MLTVTRVRDDARSGRFVWTRMLWFEAVGAGATGFSLDRTRDGTEKMPEVRSGAAWAREAEAA